MPFPNVEVSEYTKGTEIQMDSFNYTMVILTLFLLYLDIHAISLFPNRKISFFKYGVSQLKVFLSSTILESTYTSMVPDVHKTAMQILCQIPGVIPKYR